jgi:hypothetical protein
VEWLLESWWRLALRQLFIALFVLNYRLIILVSTFFSDPFTVNFIILCWLLAINLKLLALNLVLCISTMMLQISESAWHIHFSIGPAKGQILLFSATTTSLLALTVIFIWLSQTLIEVIQSSGWLMKTEVLLVLKRS